MAKGNGLVFGLCLGFSVGVTVELHDRVRVRLRLGSGTREGRCGGDKCPI